MKHLQDDNKKDQPSSSFRERLRFLKREKDRNNCLANLRSWNQQIKRVIEFPQTRTRHAFKTGSKAPPFQARVLSNKLFMALSESWTCHCKEPHEARFCLESCQKTWPHEFVVYFDFSPFLVKLSIQLVRSYSYRKGHQVGDQAPYSDTITKQLPERSPCRHVRSCK